MLPDSDAQGLYQYVGSLTRPIRYHSGTALHAPTVGSTSSRPLQGAYRLKVCTAWLPPGGSCQTALRNRLTDEGRRTVGQEMQLDERYMFQIVPFNREIQNF